MQRTPHRPPADNLPKTPSRTPLKETSNTLPPRREGSDHKERWEEAGSEDFRGLGGEGKRENARNRCFDMRVSNIATIHDKIYGLLSLIKRDKPEQPAPKAQVERAVFSGKHHLSGYSHPSTKERQEAINAARQQNWQNIMNERECLAAVSTLSRETAPQPQNQYIYKKSFDYAPKNQQRTPNTTDRVNAQNVPPQRAEKTPVKRSYLPAEYEPRPTLTPKPKSHKNQFAQDEMEYQRYEIKVERRNDDSITSKPRPTTYETGQRYPQKERSYPQKERSYPQKERSYLQMERSYPQKERSYLQMERSYPQKERKPQRIENKHPEAKLQSKFQKINVEPQKRQQNIKKQGAFGLPQSIPKPEPSKFKPIALTDESTRAQKLHTTTKLIDEQIKRIKCKIEQSESHSQWMNSKLEKQHDRNAISQTYMEEDSDD